MSDLTTPEHGHTLTSTASPRDAETSGGATRKGWPSVQPHATDLEQLLGRAERTEFADKESYAEIVAGLGAALDELEASFPDGRPTHASALERLEYQTLLMSIHQLRRQLEDGDYLCAEDVADL